MENSKISWTDHTFNPWIGCTAISPGCDACYAETLNHRWGGDNWGKGKPRKIMSEANWKKPLAWDKNAHEAGVIAKVFCGSMCDVMDDEAPASQRERLWELVDQTQNLLWLLLTKRPHRYKRYLPAQGFLHNNIMLGTTIEEQRFLAARAAAICTASHIATRRCLERTGEHHPAMTFVSYEPALGPLVLGSDASKIDWLIYGGETGANRRPMEQKWAEDIKAECESNSIAFWMKQMGASTPDKASDLIPAHLLLRQFPEAEPK